MSRNIDLDRLFQQTMDGDPIGQAVEKINAKHMLVNESGKLIIYTPRVDPNTSRVLYDRSTVGDLKLMYRNQKVYIADLQTNETITLCPVTLWLNHKNRRQYLGGVVFDPTESAGPDCLNLWCGFNVQSREGDWSLLKQHILDIICSGDQQAFAYVLRWMARLVQFPAQQGEVAIVLKGIEGCGKGILARALKHLLAQHGLHISNAKHLTGNFNAHLRDCVFLFADEAFFAGDKAHVGVLKALVTEPRFTIEAKFQNAVDAPNFLHIMMASNEDWVVPASLEARRFCVLEVLPDRKEDFAYFEAIQDQLEHGGYEAMLYELLHLDLKGFNVRRIPQTAGLAEQKKLSLKTHEQWWLDVLQRGYVYQSQRGIEELGKWHEEITTDLLYAGYNQYARDHGERHPLSRETFGRFIVAMGGRGRRLANAITGEGITGVIRRNRPTGYCFGSLEDTRAVFTKATGLEIEWTDDAIDREAYEDWLDAIGEEPGWWDREIPAIANDDLIGFPLLRA